MSTGDKQVKFTFQVDEGSVRKVTEAFTAISNAAKEMNRELASAGMSSILGGGVNTNKSDGTGSASKTIQQTQTQGVSLDIGKNFSTMGKDVSNIFKEIADSVKRGTGDITGAMDQSLGKTGKTIEDLERKIKSLDGAMKGMKETGAAMGGLSPADRQQFADLGKERNAARFEQAEQIGRAMPRASDAVAADATQPKSFLAKVNDLPTTTGLNDWTPTAGMRALGMAAVGARLILNETVATYSGFQSMEANRNQSVNGMARRLYGGDINYAMALKDAMAEEDTWMSSGGRAATGQAYVNAAAGGLWGSVKSALGMGGAGSSSPELLTSLQPTSIATDLGRRVQDATDRKLAAQEIQGRISREHYQENLGTRVSAQLMLGTGLYSTERGDKDTFNDLSSSLRAQGFDVGQYMGAVGSMRNAAGVRAGGRLGWAAMSASAFGAGAFGQIMGAGARAMGNADAGHLLARQALGGGIDKFAGMQLGQAVIGSGFDPMGTTSGAGVMAAAQAGFDWTNGAGDFNTVQRIAGGMQFGSSLVSGSYDPYQTGRNLVEAIGIAPGKGIRAQDFLASGMNFKQMLDISSGRQKDTLMMEQLGVTKEDVTNQLYASVGSFSDRWLDDKTNNPLNITMRKFTASGEKNWVKYLQSLEGDEKKNAARGFAGMLGSETAIGQEAAAGIVGLASGFGASELGLGNVGAGLRAGSVEETSMSAEAVKLKAEGVALVAGMNNMKDVISRMPDVAKGVAKWGVDLNAGVQQFLEALATLTGAINPAAAALITNKMNAPTIARPGGKRQRFDLGGLISDTARD